jgi:hypothetical protein
VSHAARLGLALALFAAVATANSGGYRYGVSDQAFYIPAIALSADPSLFPRDRAVFEPQMRFWLGDEILGAVVRTTGVDLPILFGLLQIATLATIALGALALVRGLGGDWWAIAMTLVLLTLRHRIAKTGANSLEGYFHPRMLAFGLGLFALASVVRGRSGRAALWTTASALVHTSTAVWFAGVVLVAQLWTTRRPARALAGLAALGVVAVGAWFVASRAAFDPMNPTWLGVLESRDYLFSLDWPAYAWITNLATATVVIVLHRARVRSGAAVPHEAALVAGLVALVVGFVATLPPNALAVPFFVQLQANRVFWVVDAVAVAMLALWLVDVSKRAGSRRLASVVALLALVAISRGWYVLAVETRRPLVQASLDDDAWRDVTRWLSTQPTNWHVLADPNHAVLFGSSIRVAAKRDTLVELGKDPAMAMYDEALARRTVERSAVLEGFDALTLERLRDLDARFELDVFLDTTSRSFPLPVLYRNQAFVVYDLR